MRKKAGLSEFRTTVFLSEHLSTLTLDINKQNIMRLLSNYSPLPLPVISGVLAIKLKPLHVSLIALIDMALVITTEKGHYRMSDQVEDAALKTFGYLPETTHKAVAQSSPCSWTKVSLTPEPWISPVSCLGRLDKRRIVPSRIGPSTSLTT